MAKQPHTPAAADDAAVLRMPPADLAAERAVIGAMMLDRRACDDALHTLTASDFYLTLHRHIFTIIRDLAPRHAGSVDQLAVVDEARRRGLIPAPIDPLQVNAIVHDFPIIANTIHHAQIVADKARSRAALEILTRHKQALETGVGELEQIVDETLRGLEAVRDHTLTDHADANLDEFLNEDEPEYDWIIPGLIERSDRIIVTAGEGYGKSTLLRQIAIQAAAGIHPFGHHRIDPIRVLLVDLENPRTLLRRELRKLRRRITHPIDPTNLIPISRPDGIDLLTDHDHAWLRSRIANNAPQLVIAGPIYKMSNAPNGARSEDVAKTITSRLDQLRVRYGFALILEAHTPHEQGGARPKRPFDSSLWMRWPEIGFWLNKDGRIDLWRQPRDERSWPEALTRNGAWPWTIDENPPRPEPSRTTPKRLSLDEIQEQILAQLAAAPASKRALRASVRCRDEDVDAAIDLLHQQGRIRRSETHPNPFELAPEAPDELI